MRIKGVYFGIWKMGRGGLPLPNLMATWNVHYSSIKSTLLLESNFTIKQKKNKKISESKEGDNLKVI